MDNGSFYSKGRSENPDFYMINMTSHVILKSSFLSEWPMYILLCTDIRAHTHTHTHYSL